jgi:hypothetical protein
MIRIKSVIVDMLFTAIIGCSAQPVQPLTEQEQIRAKQEEDRNSPSIPTFTYRPGAGLTIEGH